MLIQYHKNDSPQYAGQPPELYLEPQNDRDRKLLEELGADCKLFGVGRDFEKQCYNHVRIALEAK